MCRDKHLYGINRRQQNLNRNLKLNRSWCSGKKNFILNLFRHSCGNQSQYLKFHHSLNCQFVITMRHHGDRAWHRLVTERCAVAIMQIVTTPWRHCTDVWHPAWHLITSPHFRYSSTTPNDRTAPHRRVTPINGTEGWTAPSYGNYHKPVWCRLSR
jgi:hypothetical protein